MSGARRVRRFGSWGCRLGWLMLGLSACTLDGPDTAPRTLGAATEVSIGMAAGCARREDGQVLCWGGNSHAPLAADIPALRGATVVSAGNGDRCALFATGAVRCQAAGDVVLPETPATADHTSMARLPSGTSFRTKQGLTFHLCYGTL